MDITTGITHTEAEEQKRAEEKGQVPYIRNHYRFFGLVSFCYSMLYTFCLYKNYYGITFPVLAVGTVSALALCMKKLGRKPDRWFYFYGSLSILISISAVLTANRFVHNCNLLIIIVLLNLAVFHLFYEDARWNISDFVKIFFHQFFQMAAHCLIPFQHLNGLIRNSGKKESRYLISVGAGLLISIPLVGIILTLLSSADAVFSRVLHKFVLEFLDPIQIFTIIIMVLFSYVCFYTFISGATVRMNENKTGRIQKSFDALIAITFTSVLAIIYLLFCGIQIVYLFTGGPGALPDGFTFAEYARRGFFELLFVSMINIVIVLFCNARFREHKTLKRLLTLISLCTYILLASSAYRMLLYIGTYYLTFLRIFVLWFLVVLFLLLTGLIISMYREKFSYFRYAVLVLTICYMIFGYMRPDYVIASYNVSHKEKLHDEDMGYLMSLSMDAAPVIASIEDKQIAISELSIRYYYMKTDMHEYFTEVHRRTGDQTVRTYNYARNKARKAADCYLSTH